MEPSVIILIASAYLVLLFSVAWASSRRADNQTFFTGNRRSPWWAVAWGMIGASMSGVTFVSVPGMVGASGWAYLQMAMGFVAGDVAIALIIIPLHYRMGNISVYEYLDRRFGVRSHRTGAWMFFVSKMLGAAVRIYLVCAVLQLLVFQPLGVPFWVNATLTMVLVWLYTFRGGVRSIVWTDGLRTLFLIAGVGFAIYFVARELGLDFAQAGEVIRQSELSRVWFFDDPDSPKYFFKQFFAGLFIVVAMTGLDQDMMQLPLSCRRRSDAQRNFVISGMLQFVVITMFLSLGVLLSVFASARGIVAGGDELFPTVAVFGGLPTVVGVMFVLGLVSSTWSSAGSALTALTTSFTVDILGNRTSKKVRQIVHACMAVGMVIAILAFRAVGSTSVIDAVYTLASYTYGPLLGLFVFGMTSKRAVRDRFVPLVAIAAPVLCLVLDLHSEQWFGGYRMGYELLIVNAFLTILGCRAISRRS